MSSVNLDLVPRPALMLVQGIIFLVAWFVIDRLFLRPYLKLKDRREGLTIGQKGVASDAVDESERLAEQITNRLRTVSDEERQFRESVRRDALAKKDAQIREAEKLVREEIADTQKQLQSEITKERQKIPGLVESLSKLVFEQAIR